MTGKINMGNNLIAVRNFMGILCHWIRKNQVGNMMLLCAENVVDLDHNFPSFFIIYIQLFLTLLN